MIMPEPEASSVARLTLFPGLPSTSSMLGMESPAWTMIAAVAGWMKLQLQRDVLFGREGEREE
jgi:hypothetical protein